MVVKTRTAILVLLVSFFVFFSMAVYLIGRYMVEIQKPGPENSVYVSCRFTPNAL